VNDWLADPARIPDFLQALTANGWIRRHQDPRESRFWRLLQGEHARMFGVFSAYELQVVHDWIAGDWQDAPRELSFRARRRMLEEVVREGDGGKQPRAILRGPGQRLNNQALGDAGSELRLLEDMLTGMDSREEQMALLVRLMSPTLHHSAAGLMATRIYSGMLA
jgi:hypothetical protein